MTLKANKLRHKQELGRYFWGGKEQKSTQGYLRCGREGGGKEVLLRRFKCLLVGSKGKNTNRPQKKGLKRENSSIMNLTFFQLSFFPYAFLFCSWALYILWSRKELIWRMESLSLNFLVIKKDHWFDELYILTSYIHGHLIGPWDLMYRGSYT